jgi:CRISPR/Cas system Type II protein with McrA/HNH and RuvC-like nuclease domain
MVKILGLDLGPNSIGWEIVEKENNYFSHLDKEVKANGKKDTIIESPSF